MNQKLKLFGKMYIGINWQSDIKACGIENQCKQFSSLEVLAFREQKLEALKLQAAIAAQQQEEEEEKLRAAEEKERKRRDMQHKQVRHLIGLVQ